AGTSPTFASARDSAINRRPTSRGGSGCGRNDAVVSRESRVVSRESRVVSRGSRVVSRESPVARRGVIMLVVAGSPYAADLELASQCAAGDAQAWERFILEYRPVLYRAADALDPSGGAREVADSLYAELYGVRDGGGERRSLFHYFQGRSSLATWLRAVLSQRYVDRLRAQRRLEPLPAQGPASSSRGGGHA